MHHPIGRGGETEARAGGQKGHTEMGGGVRTGHVLLLESLVLSFTRVHWHLRVPGMELCPGYMVRNESAAALMELRV